MENPNASKTKPNISRPYMLGGKIFSLRGFAWHSLGWLFYHSVTWKRVKNQKKSMSKNVPKNSIASLHFFPFSSLRYRVVLWSIIKLRSLIIQLSFLKFAIWETHSLAFIISSSQESAEFSIQLSTVAYLAKQFHSTVTWNKILFMWNSSGKSVMSYSTSW